MLRSLADNLYSKNNAVKWLKNQFPQEEIVFASAATLLETKNAASVGWSLRRFFQHRGVVIITPNQIVFKNSLLSFSGLLYLVLFLLSLIMFLESRDWDYLLGVLFAGLLVLQFLPYQKQISLKDIRTVKLERIRGIFTTGSLLSVYMKNKVFNIVPAQLLNEDVMHVISSKKM
jgi:uncharacterized membrane protein